MRIESSEQLLESALLQFQGGDIPSAEPKMTNRPSFLQPWCSLLHVTD